jgi:signal transduction histidine kinase
MLCLCIADDGPGIDAAQRETALARGARIDESAPGSGLGLSIVQELVRLYGGSLQLDRSPLGGLKVVMKLPALLAPRR